MRICVRIGRNRRRRDDPLSVRDDHCRRGLALERNGNLIVTDTSGNQTRTNINYSETADLQLLALWDGIWEVSNPYAVDVAIEWRVKNGKLSQSVSGRLARRWISARHIYATWKTESVDGGKS